MASAGSLIPPRKAQRSVALSSQIAAKALDQIEVEVGGRAALIDALLHASDLSPDLDYVIGIIADPRSDTRKLATLCAEGQISVGELLEAFKKGTLAKAMVGSIRRIADATPGIVEDLLARSVVHEVDCSACRGTGVVRDLDKGQMVDVVCGACTAGKVCVDPDFARQKFVLTELAQMGRAAGGPAVVVDQRTQNNLQLPAGVTPEAYGKLVGGVDQLLYGDRVVEADPVPPMDTSAAPTYPAPDEDAEVAAAPQS